jgi:hypothetical protein
MSGRIRTVKPEWLEDQQMGKASDAARLVSVGLILLADDYGNGRGHPAYIASSVWTYTLDDGREQRAERALAELAEIGFIDLYSVGGQKYFHIRNWAKHQKVKNPGKPRVTPPAPVSTETLRRVGVESTETLTPDLRSPITDLRSPRDEAAVESPPQKAPSLSADGARRTAELVEAPPPEPNERLTALFVEPDSRDTDEQARRLLLRGYQLRYERETNEPWQGHGAAEPHTHPVARFVVRKAAQERWTIEHTANEYLDRIFRNKRLARSRWPWKAMAVDPARDWVGDIEAEANPREAAAAYDDLRAELQPKIDAIESKARMKRSLEGADAAASLQAEADELRKRLAAAKPKQQRRTA